MMESEFNNIGRTVFRGVYEIFTYVIPGILFIYMAYLTYSFFILVRWDEFFSIIILEPYFDLISSLSISGLIILIIISYIAGILAYCIRKIPRHWFYYNMRSRLYSTIKNHFTNNHKDLIDKINKFGEKGKDIPHLDNIPDEIEDGKMGIVHRFLEKISMGMLQDEGESKINPGNKITIRVGKEPEKNTENVKGADIRETYRYIRIFLESNYPQTYYKRYERLSGERRLWESLVGFFIILCFFSIIGILLYFLNIFGYPIISNHPNLNESLIVFLITGLGLAFSLHRYRAKLLSPYKDVFALFHLSQKGELKQE